jgi:Lon protease-like protein
MIEAELPADGKLYRRARGRLLVDAPNPGEEQALRSRLQKLLFDRYASNPVATARLTLLLDAGNSTSAVCDQLSYSLPLTLDVKQQLLVEANVVARLNLLLATLDTAKRPGKFPPRFSSN